jgi:hypothetical protein
MSARSRKAELFIAALLTSRTIEQAAKQAGIALITGRRWLRDPAFLEQFSQVRQESMRHVVARVQQASGQAVDTLCKVQVSSESDAARVAAARTLLDLSFRIQEVEELEARIVALERQAENES